MCEAPCNSDLEPGYYQLALSKDGGKPVDAKDGVNVEGPVSIEGTYHDYKGVRIAGAVVAIGGGLLGVAYAFKTEEECDEPTAFDPEPYCSSTHPHFAAGLVIMGLSVITGGVMLLIPDSAEISVTPGVAGLSPKQLVGFETDQLRGLSVHARF